MKETTAIHGWLAARLPADETLPAGDLEKAARILQPASDSSFYTPTLDARHKAALNQLLQRPSWQLAQVRSVTSPLGLMPLACVATLNEWASDTHGELLFEGEEILTVNAKLKQRIHT
jgi:hypothetical protein